jgi:L-alanine-DL-glutamate epimerase-like enolase superfamily enzyme
MADRTYDLLAGLPLHVESYRLDALKRNFPPSFERCSTLVRLRRDDQEGLGEDVVYDGGEQRAFQRWSRVLPLTGRCTLAEFSERLDSIDLFPRPPQQEADRFYRRWAVESAALDLALRQRGQRLSDALGLEPRPLRFVVSPRLGNPASIEPVRRLLEMRPRLGLKLDATSSWTPELMRDLAATGAVESVDFKGAYRGTVVDQPADPELYARVVEAFTRAWLEDPAITEQTDPILAEHRDRITWDAPIHSVADIESLPFPPRMLNIKPSRFGSVQALLDAYDYCRQQGIEVYGGGQFEIGPGRGQIQYLASLFHPSAPNDVAPIDYNAPPLSPALPDSPLRPAPAPLGFRWFDLTPA